MKGFLRGLDEYLVKNYERSVFDEASALHQSWTIHTHGQCVERGYIKENKRFDIIFSVLEGQEKVIPKITVKFMYPSSHDPHVSSLIKRDKKVEAMALGPILAPAFRYHVKNKTLFTVMEEKKVVITTLLEGEVLKGLISGFSRYEITMASKGAVPITILRHSIYDLRDKKGRCLLKSFQNEHRDWEKSPLFTAL